MRAGGIEGGGGSREERERETDFLPSCDVRAMCLRPSLSPSYSDLSSDFRQSQTRIANTTTPHLSLARNRRKEGGSAARGCIDISFKKSLRIRFQRIFSWCFSSHLVDLKKNLMENPVEGRAEGWWWCRGGWLACLLPVLRRAIAIKDDTRTRRSENIM